MALVRTLVLSSLLALSASASVEQAPPNFPFRDGNEAVYVDFVRADYAITYDVAAAKATVESEIRFEMPKTGFPLFDLVAAPESATLDGSAVEVAEVSDPDGISKFRLIQSVTSAGSHVLKLSHELSKNVSFKSGGVASAFSTSDLDDRMYLEQYLPASFEYDAVEMHVTVEVKGASVKHVLHANGAVTSAGDNRFTVDFPDFYTCSSVFFHLTPEDAFPMRLTTYRSVDGREIPLEIYTNYGLDDFEKEARKDLAELEADYGPFPHEKVVIYGTSPGTGGMEYSGATSSSTWALGHELFHSYNARSVMPANGNAGWMDEAISSWRDHGYDLRTSPGFSSTKMAGHSRWTRMTDDHAYDEGAAFLAYIANQMKAKELDFKVYLRDHFARHRASTMTTEMFRDEIASLASLDVAADFDRYIYGKRAGGGDDGAKGSSWPSIRTNLACDVPAAKPAIRRENPYHPRLSEAQQRAMLWK
jgi:hypothetical protein